MGTGGIMETILEKTDAGKVFVYPGSPARYFYEDVAGSDAELVQGVREQHLLHLAQTRYYRLLEQGEEEVPVVIVSAGMGESMAFQPLISGAITAPCLVVVAESRFEHIDHSINVYHQTDRGTTPERLEEHENALNRHENIGERLFVDEGTDTGELAALIDRIRERNQVGIVHIPTYAYTDERVELREAVTPPAEKIDLDELSRSWQVAERPVLLVGRGARDPAVRERIEAVADRTGATLVSTLHMDGYLETNYAGRVGMMGTPSANEALFRSDLVVALRTSVHAAVTSMDPATIAQLRDKIVQLEANPERRSRFAGRWLDTELEAVFDVLTGDGERWFDAAYGYEQMHEYIPDEVLRLGELIREHCPGKVVNLGVGNATIWLPYALGPEVKKEVSRPGSMGEAVAALNREEEPLLVLGDGELEMDLSLVVEALYRDTSANIFVMNNERLGMVTERQEAEFGEILTPKQNPLRYEGLGEAFEGVASFTAEDAEELEDAFQASLESDSVCITEFTVDERLSPELFSLERLPRLDEGITLPRRSWQ